MDLSFILALLHIDVALIGKVLAIMLIINAALSGLSATLDAVSKMTATKADDKAAGVMSQIAGWAKKVVDFLSANNKH